MNEDNFFQFFMTTGYVDVDKSERMINLTFPGKDEPFLSASYSPSHDIQYLAFATNESSTMEYSVGGTSSKGNVTGSDYVYIRYY